MVREAVTTETLSKLQPRDAAALFIARRVDGLTDSEEQLLVGWLAKNESNRKAYESADRAWSELSVTKDVDIVAAMRAHALAARPKGFAAWRPAAAAAAVVLLVVGAAIVFQPDLNPWRQDSRHAPVRQVVVSYESMRGQVRQLQLPDGSSMTLDADSTAVGRFSAAERSAQLQRGRALFEIFPDHSRPFTIDAAGHTILALGTRLDVNIVFSGITVTLLEGRVSITAKDSTALPVTLAPGQQFVERSGIVTVRDLGAAAQDEINWRGGHVHFDDQPLAEAAEVMNRYTQAHIVVDDPAIAALKVSGQFRAEDTQRFAATLAEKYKLRLRQSGDRIELVR